MFPVRKIEEITLKRTLARELGFTVGERVLCFSSLRQDKNTPDRPVGWTDVYVEAAYTELRNIVRKSPQSLISTLIEKRYGRHIAEIRQSVEAIGIPTALAAELKVKPGSPALRIVRRYFDDSGDVFEGSVTIHPMDRFRLSMRLRRERAADA